MKREYHCSIIWWHQRLHVLSKKCGNWVCIFYAKLWKKQKHGKRQDKQHIIALIKKRHVRVTFSVEEDIKTWQHVISWM